MLRETIRKSHTQGNQLGKTLVPELHIPVVSFTTRCTTHTQPTKSRHDSNKHTTLLHIRRIIRESCKSCLIRKNLSFHRRRHRRNLRQKLPIHIPDIISSVNRRLKRRHHLLSHQLIPVDVSEPGMVHDVINVVSEACLGVSIEQSTAQIKRVALSPLAQPKGYLGRHVGALAERRGEDFVIHHTTILIIKRRQSSDHFVDQRAQRPPIHRFAVRLHSKGETGETFLWMISGARYSGVPQRLCSSSPSTFCLERPKSVILMCPSESRRRFSGLRSR